MCKKRMYHEPTFSNSGNLHKMPKSSDGYVQLGKQGAGIYAAGWDLKVNNKEMTWNLEG